MKRVLAIAALLCSCSKGQLSPACGELAWTKIDKPAAQWTVQDHGADAEGCVAYNARRLAPGPDTASETAAAVATDCYTPVMGYWAALGRADEPRDDLDKMLADARSEALDEIVNYRARGCPRINS